MQSGQDTISDGWDDIGKDLPATSDNLNPPAPKIESQTAKQATTPKNAEEKTAKQATPKNAEEKTAKQATPKNAEDKTARPPTPSPAETIVVAAGSVAASSGVTYKPDLKIDVPSSPKLEIVPETLEKAGADVTPDGPLVMGNLAKPILKHAEIPPPSPEEIDIIPDANSIKINEAGVQASQNQVDGGIQTASQPISAFLNKIKWHRARFENVINDLVNLERELKITRGSISPIPPIQVNQPESKTDICSQEDSINNDINKLIRQNIIELHRLIKNHLTTFRYYNLCVTQGKKLDVNHTIELAQTSILMFHVLNTMLFRIHEDIKRNLNARQGENKEGELYQYLGEKGALLLIEDTIAKIESVYEILRANMDLPEEDLPIISEEEANEINRDYNALIKEEQRQEEDEKQHSQKSNNESDDGSDLVSRTASPDVSDESQSEPELPGFSVMVNPTPKFTDQELLDFCLEKLSASRAKVQVYARLMDSDMLDKVWFFDDYTEALETYLNDFKRYHEFMDCLNEEATQRFLQNRSQPIPIPQKKNELEADLDSQVISAPIQSPADSDDDSNSAEAGSEEAVSHLKGNDAKAENGDADIFVFDSGDEESEADDSAKVHPYPTASSEELAPLVFRGSPALTYGRMFSTWSNRRVHPVAYQGAGYTSTIDETQKHKL